MTGRRNAKSKFVPEDMSEFIDQSQFTSKPSPKGKRVPKRKAESNEDDDGKDMSTIMSQYKSAKIKSSSNLNEAACRESKQKLLNVLKEQQESRKSSDSELLTNIEDVICQLETDSNVLKENEQKLKHIVTVIMKCIQQATVSHKQKLKDLKEMYTNFKKQCDERQASNRTETLKLVDELEEDMKKLQQKLISETKRREWENFRKTLFQAMPNDD